MERYNGNFDSIRFGYVNGQERAFLIQNMCPVLPQYIKNEYLDKKSEPVRISGDLEKEIISKAKKVLALQ